MIKFNGQTYASVEDMPPEVRQVYERMLKLLPDEDKNGEPDLLQGNAANVDMVVTSSITVDGEVYTNEDDMPPEVRQKFEEATAKLQKFMGAAQGIESVSDAFPHQQQISVEVRKEIPSTQPSSLSPTTAAQERAPRNAHADAPSPVIREEKASATTLLLVVAAIVLLALITGVGIMVWVLH